MEIKINSDTQISEITPKTFNVKSINSIKNLKGGTLRQRSKAPTFCTYLPRNLDYLS